MASLIRFMNGIVGRPIRTLLGMAIIGLGLVVVGGTAGWLIALVGLVPIGLGVSGRCLLELLPRQRGSAGCSC